MEVVEYERNTREWQVLRSPNGLFKWDADWVGAANMLFLGEALEVVWGTVGGGLCRNTAAEVDDSVAEVEGSFEVQSAKPCARNASRKSVI